MQSTPRPLPAPARFRLPLLLIALLVALPLRAQVVNFVFAEDYTTVDQNFGVGAYADAGTYWNRIGPSTSTLYPQDATTLFTSDGTTATGIRVSFPSDNFGTGASHPFANDLFQSYFYTGSPETVTITGLTDGADYQLYLYAESGGGDRPITFTLGGDSFSLTSADSNSFEEGVNYGVFSFTATGTSQVFTVGPQASGEANFAGMQVIAASAVPEPATYAAIAGLAVLGLAALRRRRAA